MQKENSTPMHKQHITCRPRLNRLISFRRVGLHRCYTATATVECRSVPSTRSSNPSTNPTPAARSRSSLNKNCCLSRCPERIVVQSVAIETSASSVESKNLPRKTCTHDKRTGGATTHSVSPSRCSETTCSMNCKCMFNEPSSQFTVRSKQLNVT